MKRGIDIIFSDDHLLVVNKPSGLLSIPDRFDSTKENLVGHLRQSLGESIWIVHRIDRDTSGLICFAKSALAHRHLNQQFEDHRVEKVYLALVDGVPNPPTGIIDTPITVHPFQEGKMIASKVGKPALTHYTVKEIFKNSSLVQVEIETGRTHQIRVHFRHIGHPLLVDPLYGRREYLSLKDIRKANKPELESKERPLLDRLSLHAARLTLTHPITEEKITFEAPLPKDLRAVIHQYRK